MYRPQFTREEQRRIDRAAWTWRVALVAAAVGLIALATVAL